MNLPCEKTLWYTLPQIRSDIARELVKQGENQKDVAEKLGLTPSAVSQYIHKKRGGKAKKPKDYVKIINNAVKAIKNTEKKSEISNIICQCCSKCQKR